MIKAVLFDMDGTVLDTEPMYKKAWKAAFEMVKIDFDDELFNKCVGLPVKRTKQMIFERYNDPELFDKTFPTAAAWVYNYKKANGIPVKKGFIELSDYLKENDVKAVIATSTSHSAAEEDLVNSKIIERFNGIVGGDDIENGKPSPDPFLKAAQLAGADISECLAVEDSQNGIASAYAAKIKCVYVKDFLDVPEEVKAMATFKVASLDEIIAIIKEINSAALISS